MRQVSTASWNRLRSQIEGRNLAADDHLLQLTHGDSERLALAAAAHGTTVVSRERADETVRGIVPELSRRLNEFAGHGSPLGFFLIDGVMPSERRDDVDVRTSSAALMLCLAGLLGVPLMTEGHRDGRLIHDIYPIRQDAAKQLGSGSVELTWHTEDAHAERNPDFIALMCIRGDPEAKTLIACVKPEELADDIRSALACPDFLITADDSFDARVKQKPAKPTAILGGSSGDLIVRFDPLFTSCLTPQAEQALRCLGDYLDEKAVDVTLKAGHFLLIDNRRAVHARSAFAPKYDHSDRWVRRVSIARWGAEDRVSGIVA
jgi:TfdA family taurine catabolism dioxygenase TauD